MNSVTRTDLDRLVLGFTREPLLLNPGDVENVGRGDDLVKVDALVDAHTSLSSVGLDGLGHGERRRRDKVERHVVEREKLDERVDSSAVLQVSDCLEATENWSVRAAPREGK